MLPPDLAECASRLAAAGRACRVLEIVGSTNDEAKAWASEGAPDGAVIVADSQSAGRGRHGRTWSTPAATTLAMSVVLRPRLKAVALPPLALVVGLAVRAAIASRVTMDARVKWPNDVMLELPDEGPRKVAGILVEAALGGANVEHVVVGVGVNVARRSFPIDLEGNATSLVLGGASPTSLDRTSLACDILAALDREVALHLAAPSRIGERFSPHDHLRGRLVRLEPSAAGGDRIGRADGIEADGRLRVRFDDGTWALAVAGEVRVIDDRR